MLKTLFKHELRATAKIFIWLYVAFVAIAVLNALVAPSTVDALSMSADWVTRALVPDAVRAVITMLYGLAIAAILVVTVVMIILRFFRNLLGDEGYLMFTLPVTREQHILSKLFVGVIWSVCSVVLVCLSILLLIGTMGGLDLVVKWMNDLLESGVPVGHYVALIIVTMLVSCVSGILTLYASMAVGPNLIKNRVGGSILAFIIIQIASLVVYYAILFGVAANLVSRANMFSMLGPWHFDVVSGTGSEAGMGTAANSALAGMAVVDTILVTGIIYDVVIAVGCWFLTRYMLKRKLNLA